MRHCRIQPVARAAALAAVAAALLGLPACEEDDKFDHDPPAGQGTLYVDNETADDLDVYIDGAKTNSVDDGDTRYYDLAPGVHRVVLDDDNGDRNFRDDVDVLQGQRTILEVRTDWNDSDAYDVFVYFD